MRMRVELCPDHAYCSTHLTSKRKARSANRAKRKTQNAKRNAKRKAWSGVRKPKATCAFSDPVYDNFAITHVCKRARKRHAHARSFSGGARCAICAQIELWRLSLECFWQQLGLVRPLFQCCPSVVFSSLREEHFDKLLPKMKVGEHAALLKLWDTSTLRETEVRKLCPCFMAIGSKIPSGTKATPTTNYIAPPMTRPQLTKPHP